MYYYFLEKKEKFISFMCYFGQQDFLLNELPVAKENYLSAGFTVTNIFK